MFAIIDKLELHSYASGQLGWCITQKIPIYDIKNHLSRYLAHKYYSNYVITSSIITRRGRSFMLTTAFGFLLSGPIESIDTNVQEIVRAITCLYEQV